MNDVGDFCSDVAVSNIMYLIGVVVGVIRVAVPIVLIVLGMVDLVKALTSQDDKEINIVVNNTIDTILLALFIINTSPKQQI